MNGKRVMYEFNKNTIKQFEDFDSKREVGRITKLVRDWQEGWDCINPIIVKPKGQKYQIIDGHHRVSSMKEYFVKNPIGKVNGELYVVSPLSIEEAIDVYLHLDETTRSQSVRDVIKVSSPLARIFNYIDKEFPIKVGFYGTENVLEYPRIFQTYFSAESKKAHSLNKDKLVQKIIGADLGDYYNLKEFYNMMKEVFGIYHYKSSYYKIASLFFLNKVWFQNKNVVGETRIKHLLKKNLKDNPLFKDDFCNIRGRDEIDFKLNDVLSILNKGNKSNKIIISDFKTNGGDVE